MKKTITILLLTAVCITVFTSCSVGSGLVAELLEELGEEDVLVEPSVDHIIQTPPEPWVDQTAPIEVKTPWLTDFIITTVEGYNQGGQLRHYEELHANIPEAVSTIRIDGAVQELVINGWIGLAKADYVIFGYSIDGGEPVFSSTFQQDPEALLKDSLYKDGADYVSAFSILVPVGDITNTHQITVWYEGHPIGAESDYLVQREYFTFRLNRDPYNDDTACG